ncbi:NAD-dependent epimerase/dehydratase family protein [Chryseobacterium sp. C-71]|uniref:NAD-dependent epimerase/dehydratase family protein n=1 Tax=Chryseobacterium sp. C-71 TaxID=2893882 RepID=UPI001E536402|nr:NAD-dependent epimerase/dehydratase family protein [Chryseobacterium sp. C-71]UFH30874.1 NAD-dependent epimerase/dehydratase family protein [Chryseobacterium sp. C-71]
MKILIIGSKGFIGSHAYHYFSRKHPETFGADVSVDYADNNYFNIDSTNSDYNDIFENHQFDVCINCSGAASVPDSLVHRLRDFTLNAQNVFKILDAIKKNNPLCKFINLSSAAVYGNPTNLPIKECDAISPVSPYGFHKKIAEEILEEFHQLFQISCCSLRIFSAYGVGLQKQLLWDISQKVKFQKDIELYGTGRETRDFINVEDILQSIELVIHNGDFNADVYNIANGVQVKIKDIAELILKELDFKGNLSFSGHEREGDPLYWVADITKLKTLGYTQQISIKEGITKYVQWAKDIM